MLLIISREKSRSSQESCNKKNKGYELYETISINVFSRQDGLEQTNNRFVSHAICDAIIDHAERMIH